MKSYSLKVITSFFFALIVATIAHADVKIKQRQSIGGQTFESTVYIKGKRERREQKIPGLNMQIASVTQCDLKRTLQINDAARKYTVTPFDDEGAPQSTATNRPAPPSSRANANDTRKGGIVTYNITITDTGERKQMFGLTARHIKTSFITESSPDACNPSKQHIESDGWYVDFDYSFNCGSDKPFVPTGRNEKPGCRDQVRYKRTGNGKIGYPLLVTTTFYDDNNQSQNSFTQETVELSRDTLNAKLFDVPTDYAEAKNSQELYDFGGMNSVAGMTSGRNQQATGDDENGNSNKPAPRANSDGVKSTVAVQSKRPGSLRVGVIAIGNQTEGSFSTDAAREKLIASLNGSGLDAVPVDAQSIEAVMDESRAKQCDFVLYTDVAGLKKPSASAEGASAVLDRTPLGGLGGFGRKAAPSYVVNLNFRLLAVPASGDEATPRLESKSDGKGDSDTNAVNKALDGEAKAVAGAAKKRN
ncbi:MAG: hypothetical protein NVSMB56_11760 [Pyrinomonadaceae bacterium]